VVAQAVPDFFVRTLGLSNNEDETQSNFILPELLGRNARPRYIRCSRASIIYHFSFIWIFPIFIFLCPSCKLLAIKTHPGLYVPWVGDKCKFCGEKY